ncbi:SDR family NAD(P)-dependent oxidoreductase [Shewanella sp. VB17]|uniref:SDR family NAD(P)-dependent oxidoreductase n=1 Tax=Shewanella sp. VB17 TaxID=2739432 RepID=UPI001565402A|nr:SDR family NAD(P)-dependent oxidoreductase [Shewanella sp. VB17]NRD74262.1 SDR family NAD(P)-dependent oxidoreductase [Shewanella sp. VB17]
MSTVMITGASSGIGKALAEHYVQLGWQVIACGRDKVRLTALASSSSLITTLAFDMTDKQQVQAIELALPALDLLIFNAGDCQYIDDVLDFNAERFERVIQTNLISVAYGLQYWLKHVNQGGRVVFVSSSAELLALPRAEAYGASKAALSYLGESLSIDLAQHNIHVSIVRPGFVATPLTAKNNFPMPMKITSEQAAVKIVQGINKGKHHIDFPSHFTCIMKILSCLPFTLWRRLAVRM